MIFSKRFFALLFLAALLTAILLAYLGIGIHGRIERPAAIPAATPEAAGVPRIPHVAGDPASSLKEVFVQAVYFLPRDRQELLWGAWKEETEKTLAEARAFHRLQFLGSSELTFEVASEPVIGENDGVWYDSTDTNRGNPHAWNAIHEELDRRMPLKKEPGVFSVRLVLYEGVGALGGGNRILVSSGYLRIPLERPTAASELYHELGHTFGLRDAYDYETGAPKDEDIMGAGRRKPIGRTYLSEEAKRELGIR